MQDQSDAQLLRDFAERADEAAFRELVTRHTDFVYSAALRQVESSAIAGDLAQSVFTDLARKAQPLAEKITGDSSLAGWLHRSTRYAALNHLRDTRRRRDNERQAMEQLLTNSDSATDWEQIRPALDEALDSLDDEDREALLLRYFKNHDFRAVGHALGVSDDTAQKRVSRAVEKLREFFSKQKITIGAGGLVVLISANAVQAAPLGLAVTISAAALAGTTIATTSTLIAATKTIAMTTLQKITVTAALTAAVGAGLYQAKQTHDARAEVQTIQQQQAPLAEQMDKLQNRFADATNRLADLLAENMKLKSGQNQKELLALRGKVTLLSNEAAKAAKAAAKKATNPMANMFSDPLMQEQMREQTSRKVKSDYAKLFANLNLPQDKADALNNLIVKKLNVYDDLSGDLMSGNPDQSQKDIIMKAAAQKIQAAGDEINQLLGADDYAKFKNYENTMDQRYEVSGPQGFARELPAGQTLTSDQTEQLISVMAEVEQNFKFSSGARRTSPQGLTSVIMEKPASEINVDAFTAEMQQLDDRYLARAQSILTPDQITAFQSYLANQMQDLKYSLLSLKASPSGIAIPAPRHL